MISFEIELWCHRVKIVSCEKSNQKKRWIKAQHDYESVFRQFSDFSNYSASSFSYSQFFSSTISNLISHVHVSEFLFLLVSNDLMNFFWFTHLLHTTQIFYTTNKQKRHDNQRWRKRRWDERECDQLRWYVMKWDHWNVKMINECK